LHVTRTDAGTVDAATRLVELAADPVDAELLALLIVDEIRHAGRRAG
jgi:AraC-type transcriptional regulator N-terminus